MGLFRKKQISIPDLYKKKRISAEDVADSCAYGFLKAAYGFYASNRMIQKEILWHNKENEKYQTMIHDFRNGNSQISHLDKLNLCNHRDKKKNLLSDIRNRNALDITCGYLELECIFECNLIRNNELFTKRAFLEKCLSSQNREYVKAVKDDFMTPSPAEVEKYYDICNEYLRLMHADQNQSSSEELHESVEDMFGENGIILLLNEQGERIPAEDDPLKNYIEIDYKEVI